MNEALLQPPPSGASRLSMREHAALAPPSATAPGDAGIAQLDGRLHAAQGRIFGGLSPAAIGLAFLD
jgi:hypothetical protein